MTRAGRASSSRSKSSSSMAVACLENRLKLTPVPVRVAPSGDGAPACAGAALGGRASRGASDVRTLLIALLLCRSGLAADRSTELEPRIRVRLAEQLDER